MLKKVLLSIALLSTFIATWFCVAYLYIENNFFSWDPTFDFLFFMYIVLPFLFLYLSYKISGSVNKIIVLLISIVSITTSIVFACTDLVNEELSSGFLGRTELSPLWFKFLCGTLSLLPLIGVAVRLRHQKK